MATNLLAIGNTPTTGAEFTFSEAAAVFLSVPGGSKAPDGVVIEIWIKASTGLFNYFASLTGLAPSGILPAGTYRAVRTDGNAGLEKA